ncbi:MAG: hypothetical protein M3406_03010 [Chloroflexota bacterium]|nr:hypothetical protein [Chloroflexota bacterium]
MTAGTRRWASIAVAAVLAIAVVGLPILAFFDERPGRFGWQMYATINPAPEASVERADGLLEPVDLGPLLADARAEIEWADPLAELLCRDESVAAVVVTDRAGRSRVPCP